MYFKQNKPITLFLSRSLYCRFALCLWSTQQQTIDSNKTAQQFNISDDLTGLVWPNFNMLQFKFTAILLRSIEFGVPCAALCVHFGGFSTHHRRYLFDIPKNKINLCCLYLVNAHKYFHFFSISFGLRQIARPLIERLGPQSIFILISTVPMKF